MPGTAIGLQAPLKEVLKRTILTTVDEPIPHYELRCKGCGAPILLPKNMVGWLFAAPGAPPNRSHAIAVACRLRKSVETSFL